MEDEEEGRKGLGFTEEKDGEGRSRKDMQEKLSKLFGQPADPWASTGQIQIKSKTDKKTH